MRYDELDREILIRLLVNVSARVEQRAAEAAKAATLARQLQSLVDQERQARQADQAAFESRLGDLAREREALVSRAAGAEAAATLAADLATARADLDRTRGTAETLDRKLNEITTVYNQIRTQSQNREESLLAQIRELKRGRKQSEDAASYATATLATAKHEHAAELKQWQEREREMAMQLLTLDEEKTGLSGRLTELETALHDRDAAVDDLTRRLAETDQDWQRRLAEERDHATTAQQGLDEQREIESRRAQEAEQALAVLAEARTQLLDERDQALTQLAAAENALAARDAEVQALQRREEGLADRAGEAGRIEESLRQHRQQSELQAKALREELTAARQSLEDTRARLEDEQTRLLQAAQREQELQAYVQRLTGELQESHAQVTQRELQSGGEDERIRKLEADFARERDGFNQIITRLSAESRHNSELAVQLQHMLETEQAKPQPEAHPAVARAAELEAENEASKARAADTLSRLSHVQQQFTRLKVAYEEAQSAARQRQDELSTALADSRRSLDSLKYQLSELLAERNENGQRNGSETVSLQKELVAARGTADQMTALADTLRAEKTELTEIARAEVERLQGQMAEATRELKAANERHAALSRENEALTRDHATLQAEHQATIEEARGVIDTLRHDLEARATEEARLARVAAEDRTRAGDEIAALQAELAQGRESLTALARDAEDRQGRLQQVQAELTETRQAWEADRQRQQADAARHEQWEQELRQRVEQFAEENERRTAELGQRVTALTAELAQAHAELDDSLKQKEDTSRIQADAQTRIQILTQNAEEHERVIKDARRRLEAAEEQQRTLRQDAAQNEQTLLRQIERLKSDVRTAGMQLAEARRRVEMQEEQLRNLRQQRTAAARDVPRAAIIEIPRGTGKAGEPGSAADEAAADVAQPEIVASPSMARPASGGGTPRAARAPRSHTAGHPQQQTLNKLETQLQSELQTWDQMRKDEAGNGTLSKKMKDWLGVKPRPTDTDKP